MNSHLSFPIYVLLDFDMLFVSIKSTYSVQVVLRECFVDKRNFPFLTSKAAKLQSINNLDSGNFVSNS